MTLHPAVRLAAAAVVTVAAIVLFTRASRAETPQGAREHDALVARGDYLTHHVAMCVQCHSPRDARGDIIVSEEFRGAPVLVQAPFWHPQWASQEPAIAGLPGLTDEQVIALLTTGQAPGREPPRRPMPPFRLHREDAEAIVAYLRTR
jgi:mono/diheme cytochrome c family protein